MIKKLNTAMKLKLAFLSAVIGLVTTGLFLDNGFVPAVGANSSGPPIGLTGAPDELSCNLCHEFTGGTGQFSITAPPTYVPGQTYQIQVQHVVNDNTRKRWGFELTALANLTMAGSFANLGNTTQIETGGSSRSYIMHTMTGTFANQTGGATWSFNWTAPANNVGPVTFYASGNQADFDHTQNGDRIYNATATSQPRVVAQVSSDFDGDRKTDISIFRPAPAEWWYLKSSNGGNAAAQFGQTTDKLVPGDYTGDGKWDFAFFRPSTGQWYILRSQDFTYYALPFGTSTDLPAPADYDGDGKTDVAVYRPSAGTWFIQRSTDGGVTISGFGGVADVPVPADFDGDGKADIAIWRPAVGEWWIQRSTSGLLAFQFGTSSDRPVRADYTGDGKADGAFFRPSTGEWFVLRSENFSYYSAPFGSNGDVPVPGDYDGDAKSDFAVFRPSTSTWYMQRSTAGTAIQQFGITGDQPVPAAFVP